MAKFPTNTFLDFSPAVGGALPEKSSPTVLEVWRVEMHAKV